MKRTMVCLAAILTAATLHAESTRDLDIHAVYVVPSASDDWKSGTGVELEGRYWLNSDVGIALSLGWESWKVKPNTQTESSYYRGYEIFAYAEATGDASLIPLGALLLYRPIHGEQFALTLDAGLRYAIVNSSVKVEAAAAAFDGAGNILPETLMSAEDDLDIDNAFLGVIGADAALSLSEHFALSVGMSYRFDLTKPGVSDSYGDTGDTEFGGFVAQGGIRATF